MALLAIFVLILCVSFELSPAYDDGSWKPDTYEGVDGFWNEGKYENYEHNKKRRDADDRPRVTVGDSERSQPQINLSDKVIGGDKSKGLKVVCYFEDWASHVTSKGRFGEDSLLDAPCTHVIFSFATLNENSNQIVYSYEPRLIRQLKEKGVKVMLAVGGARDSEGTKYSNMASSAETRRTFIDSVVVTLNRHGFDGFDVDWEYPTCINAPGDCGALPKDKENFVTLIRELRQALGDKILTIASHPLENVVSKAFDIPALVKEVDWFNVMTYDLHGTWDNKALHHSPLSASDQISLEGSVKLYKGLGVPPQKIVLGTPTYGRSVKIQDPSQPKYEAPINGPGEAGPYTQETGLLSNLEICEKVKRSGWKVEKGTAKVGPFAYGDGTFVGFDDPEMAQKKALFAKEQGLGGMMVWSLGSEDFSDVCGCGKYPTVTALYKTLVANKPVPPCQF